MILTKDLKDCFILYNFIYSWLVTLSFSFEQGNRHSICGQIVKIILFFMLPILQPTLVAASPLQNISPPMCIVLTMIGLVFIVLAILAIIRAFLGPSPAEAKARYPKQQCGTEKIQDHNFFYHNYLSQNSKVRDCEWQRKINGLR